MTRRLDDGYQTLIEFAENPAIKLWEKSVTPPGIDGGDAIDTTTMLHGPSSRLLHSQRTAPTIRLCIRNWKQ